MKIPIITNNIYTVCTVGDRSQKNVTFFNMSFRQLILNTICFFSCTFLGNFILKEFEVNIQKSFPILVIRVFRVFKTFNFGFDGKKHQTTLFTDRIFFPFLKFG